MSIIALKSGDQGLTGTLVATSDAPWMRTTTGKEFEIQDGKFSEGKFTFKIVHDTEKGQRTSLYEGTIQGNRMVGVVKFRGVGQTWDLEATKLE